MFSSRHITTTVRTKFSSRSVIIGKSKLPPSSPDRVSDTEPCKTFTEKTRYCLNFYDATIDVCVKNMRWISHLVSTALRIMTVIWRIRHEDAITRVLPYRTYTGLFAIGLYHSTGRTIYNCSFLVCNRF